MKPSNAFFVAVTQALFSFPDVSSSSLSVFKFTPTQLSAQTDKHCACFANASSFSKTSSVTCWEVKDES